MKETTKVRWTEGMAFEADVDGFKINMDAKSAVGGSDSGPRPKPLMMVALAGCTGMDVVSILKKMRVEVDSFDIRVEGELTEEHPKHYSKMHIVYEFTGTKLPSDKINKAVNLSQERYCGVSASYNKAMELTFEVIIH